LLVSLGFVVLTVTQAALAAPRNDYLLVLEHRTGPYSYLDSFRRGKPDAYSAALKAFGTPTRFLVEGNLCRVSWAGAGITIGFASDLHLCSTGSLFRSAWYGLTLFGPKWHTRVGIRIGDPISRVRRLYPKARFQTDGARNWLVLVRRKQDEFNFVLLAVAIDRLGRVTSIEVPAAYVY
jgi:hypothetical protein